ncbi:MAG: hypothetical protein OXF56_22990 [Rhodobacteraceae bacterium]|nr:hypothetical protein [Paracoccaceae bacterium]
MKFRWPDAFFGIVASCCGRCRIAPSDDGSEPRARSFRSIGITAYLENPGMRVAVAQYPAGHAKAETTCLHGRRAETISLDETERIGI